MFSSWKVCITKTFCFVSTRVCTNHGWLQQCHSKSRCTEIILLQSPGGAHSYGVLFTTSNIVQSTDTVIQRCFLLCQSYRILCHRLQAFEHLCALELVRPVGGSTRHQKEYRVVTLLVDDSQVIDALQSYPGCPTEVRQWGLSSAMAWIYTCTFPFSVRFIWRRRSHTWTFFCVVYYLCLWVVFKHPAELITVMFSHTLRNYKINILFMHGMWMHTNHFVESKHFDYVSQELRNWIFLVPNI